MKLKKLLLFSTLIEEPPEDKKWKSFVYKTTKFLQYITSFFAIIALIKPLTDILVRRTLDFQIFVPILWYFAPFIFYFLMLYIAPVVFTFVVGLLLFKMFR